MSSCDLPADPSSSLAPSSPPSSAQKRCVVSITTDRQAGGIANALVSYSDALAAKGHNHIIILPSTAVVIPALIKAGTARLITRPVAAIKFHLLTRGLFAADIRCALASADAFFLHNSVLVRFVRPSGAACFLINHSGKTRHLDKADHIIFLTHIMYSRAVQKLPRLSRCPDKLHVIPHGFAVADAAAIPRTSPKPRPDPVRLVAAGRFVEKKGFAILIEAARQVERAGIVCRIDIYGDGPLKQALQSQITASAITSVTLKGWSDNLKGILAEADGFCSPSLDEPFGLVIGEAMTMGLPVIASDTDGAVELFGHNKSPCLDVVPRHGGLIVRAGDPAALAQAIGRFCTDSRLRDAAGQQARKRIEERFSTRILADRLDQVIR